MSSDHRVRHAAAVIKAGGVVAYPTESVFGLGCDPANSSAVERIIAIKKRDPTAGLILLAWDRSQIDDYVEGGLGAFPAVLDSWPGPISWVLPASWSTPALVTGRGNTVALRVTKHPVAAALCKAAGFAIVSTSANLSGEPAARTAGAVETAFDSQIDYVLTGETGGADLPSEIRDARSGKVLRQGG